MDPVTHAQCMRVLNTIYMDPVTHAQCLRVLNVLIAEKGLPWFFMDPVDPELFTDYLSIVKHPMDLKQIKVRPCPLFSLTSQRNRL